MVAGHRAGGCARPKSESSVRPHRSDREERKHMTDKRVLRVQLMSPCPRCSWICSKLATFPCSSVPQVCRRR